MEGVRAGRLRQRGNNTEKKKRRYRQTNRQRQRQTDRQTERQKETPKSLLSISHAFNSIPHSPKIV